MKGAVYWGSSLKLGIYVVLALKTTNFLMGDKLVTTALVYLGVGGELTIYLSLSLSGGKIDHFH